VDRLLRATINSWKGLKAAARREEAFRQELIVLLVATPFAFVVADDWWKRVALIAILVLLLVVELINTAIEKLCDRMTLANEPVIGYVKDMGSAAVGLMILIAGLFWLIAIGEYFAWL
jgi:diacylglycerol kinase (ATP)